MTNNMLTYMQQIKEIHTCILDSNLKLKLLTLSIPRSNILETYCRGFNFYPVNYDLVEEYFNINFNLKNNLKTQIAGILLDYIKIIAITENLKNKITNISNIKNVTYKNITYFYNEKYKSNSNILLNFYNNSYNKTFSQELQVMLESNNEPAFISIFVSLLFGQSKFHIILKQFYNIIDLNKENISNKQKTYETMFTEFNLTYYSNIIDKISIELLKLDAII
jgi:hypothetical protein